MVKKQNIIFGGLFPPQTSLKILVIAMAIPAFFALSENKIDTPKFDTLFLYQS